MRPLAPLAAKHVATLTSPTCSSHDTMSLTDANSSFFVMRSLPIRSDSEWAASLKADVTSSATGFHDDLAGLPKELLAGLPIALVSRCNRRGELSKMACDDAEYICFEKVASKKKPPPKR